jgi:hypothetical protein
MRRENETLITRRSFLKGITGAVATLFIVEGCQSRKQSKDDALKGVSAKVNTPDCEVYAYTMAPPPVAKVFAAKEKDKVSPYDDIPKPQPWKKGDSLFQQMTKVQRYTVGGRDWERVFVKTYEWDGNDWIENEGLRNMLDYPLMTKEESIELGRRIKESLRKQEEDLPAIYRDIPTPVDPPKEGEPITREVGKIVQARMPDGRDVETTAIRYFRWDEESYRWIETTHTLSTTPLMTEEEKQAVPVQK